MKFQAKKVYKSKAPYDTIRQVREILYDCGIFCTETNTYHANSRTAAAELRLGDLLPMGIRIATNGKGMDSRYALASAYGEFMERLECGILLGNYRNAAYARGELPFRYAPDEKQMTLSRLGEDFAGDIRRLFCLTDAEYRELYAPVADLPLHCVPFRDALTGQTRYFPMDALMAVVSSNGMCAGNTPHEALAQGISELFERDALMRIYRDNPEMKLLPREWFRDTPILEKLEHLETLGYAAGILDASVGLDYPVVGLVLKNELGVAMNLGADPNPVVALERCLTELFQLVGTDSIDKRITKESCGTRKACKNILFQSFYDLEFVRSKNFGSGDKPDNIFYLQESYTDRYTWNEADEDDYDYLLALIRRLGYHIYVRDCSYLGFPAYFVFIPEISLADCRGREFGEVFVKVLRGQVRAKDPDEQSYQAVLPILKTLCGRMQAWYASR